jgi:hypothetical protein
LAPAVRIKAMNLKASFQQAVDDLQVAGLEVSQEDLRK